LQAHGWGKCQLELIKNSVHYVVDEQPEAVAELILRYAPQDTSELIMFIKRKEPDVNLSAHPAPIKQNAPVIPMSRIAGAGIVAKSVIIRRT